MTELLSIRAYARHRKARGLPGGSHTAVQKAIQCGRLDRSVEHEGSRYYIDADLADREWVDNTDATAQREKVRAPSRRRGVQQGGLFGDAEVDAAQQTTNQAGRGADDLGPSLAKSQRVEAVYRSLLRRLEYEERAGLLCEVAPMRAKAFATGRTVLEAVMAIPDRLSSELAHEQDEFKLREKLRVELALALEVLTDGPLRTN